MPGAAYTDIAQLSRYRTSDASALPGVARQFESMFVDMMLKAARAATAVLSEGNPFDSFETRLHAEMLDHQLAVNMSEHGGIGLAEVLVRQLGGDASPSATPASTDTLADATLRAARRQRLRTQQHGAMDTQAQGARAGEKQSAFADPVDFVRRVLPAVRNATAGTAIPPLAVLAQAALETGWGRAVIGNGSGGSSHNLFGIKATDRWRGPSATVPTLEVRDGVARRERAAFRVYDDIEHAVRDLLNTLTNSARYRDVLAAGDERGYAEAIGRAGYATDPSYTQKLRAILGSDTLRSALDAVLGEESVASGGATAPRTR